ncbi:MAG: GAF domain-containing protein [Microscillaceae bacterium]|nr:GAF domain-containing protein [Microscillaceae bacterium]
MAKKKSMFNFLGFNSISGKIIWGFISIYAFFIVNATYSFLTVSEGAQNIIEFSKTVNPSIDMIDNFRLMVTQSQLYTMSWVHEHTEIRPEDKEALKEIHLNFPEFKDQLVKLKKDWRDKNLDKQMDEVFTDFETLIKHQQAIREKLAEPEDYFDQINKLESENILNNDVLPLADNILKKLNTISEQKKRDRESTQTALLESFNQLIRTTIIMGIILILVGFLVSWWTRRQIVRPIKYINSVFVKLGIGELPEDKHFKFGNDEIGEMAESADKLIYSLKETSRFAENIGKGNYQASYTPLSEYDILGNALLEMRDNLAAVAEEDRRRSWTTEGLVLFSEILKQNNNDIVKLSDSIISSLVKYTKSNQGGLFVVENYDPDVMHNGEEPYMKLASCYAWDKKKFLEQKVYIGDGLAGQAWQEHATIYLTEVPDGYVEITSGLGKANPNSILIVPLKLNEEVFGVIELASFNEFYPYEIEFVEKIAESIASTIASVRINERTKRLLDESTLMTEQMKSQEEEMRQNMEELQSTQEHIERSQREVKAKEELFNFSNIMIETDRKFIIQTSNDLAEGKLRYDQIEFEGMLINYIVDSHEKIEEAKERLRNGKKWTDFLYLKTKNGSKIFVKGNASPINDDDGRTNKYLFIFDDITHARS